MADELVRLAIEDGIARVELQKPPVNALDLEMVKAIAAAVMEVAASGATAAVFSGGPKTLAAGGDIKWMHAQAESKSLKELRPFLRSIQRLFDDIEGLPMPTVAVVRGYTLGGGLELALACDLRVAADDAQIGFPEATLGLLPAAGGTQRLTEIVGKGVALELLYTGRFVTAADGLRLGLLNRVVAPDAVDAAVAELLAEISRSTPAAIAASKACVMARIENGRNAGFRVEGAAIERLALLPDTFGKLTDFINRRKG